MRAVLYDDDLEPITIINLSPWMLQYLGQHQRISMPVPADLGFLSETPEADTPIQPLKIVHIKAERLVWEGRRKLILYTHDAAGAMLLRSVFLPGQHRAVEDARRQAIAQTLLAFFEGDGK